MIKQLKGFTLIELIILIVVVGIVASTIMLASYTGLSNASKISNQLTATLLAQQCMEGLLGNRLLNGYGAFSCPSSPSHALCNNTSGYTITTGVACTTIGSDSNFKTITVSISGNGTANLQVLIASY